MVGGGGGRIRTYVARRAPDLQSGAFGRSATPPRCSSVAQAPWAANPEPKGPSHARGAVRVCCTAREGIRTR